MTRGFSWFLRNITLARPGYARKRLHPVVWSRAATPGFRWRAPIISCGRLRSPTPERRAHRMRERRDHPCGRARQGLRRGRIWQQLLHRRDNRRLHFRSLLELGSLAWRRLMAAGTLSTSPMTNHHLLLACFLPAKRFSRKHDRSPKGMVIWSTGLFALLFRPKRLY